MWDEKEQVWHLTKGLETCRVLAFWALQMKHTRFNRKKNASTVVAAILGLPATKGLGFIGDGWRIRTWFSMRKPYAIAERGFSLNKQTREKGFRSSEILLLRPSSLLLKLERWGVLWFDISLGITVALRPGCVYRAVVHSNLVHIARLPRCRMPHISTKGSRKTGVTSYTKIYFWQRDTPSVKKYTNLLYHNFIHKKNQGEYI